MWRLKILLDLNLNVYMCIKLSLKNLIPKPYPIYPTSTYTCEVTLALRVHDGDIVVTCKIISMDNFEK